MQLKVVKHNNGSILGKIPIINMSSNHNTSAGANSPPHNVRRRRSHENLRADDAPRYRDQATQTNAPRYRDQATQTDAPRYRDQATQTNAPRYRDQATQTNAPRYRDQATQTDAINDYREHALSTRSPRATESLRRRGERRSHANAQPHTTSSSSRDRKDEVDKMTDRFADQSISHNAQRVQTDYDEDARKKIDEDESFFPTPKVTFLIDQPSKLTCQICLDTTIKMGITGHERSENDLSILPCGHVACYGCLEAWVKTHESCPFCRKSLKRSRCSHPAKPVRIAQDTIQRLPMTLARGGTISSRCMSCTEKASLQMTMEKVKAVSQKFRRLRRDNEAVGTESRTQELKTLEATLESLPVDWTLEHIHKRGKEW
ncbi:hypothetical protein F4820DRAFT_469825 [Hypoxylon rubiginosum]|uniref:Uncharacterized protein n=1 Tax=Hypoxylon rubiginosum TaxID=110542 RepID=A0ACB9Z2P3_9PEZI|nr:hypothetical protein F4820DRAFT_469825 [Hypoxylon rubiginosum]